ncbi:DNA ligase N terminus-domain-containing protein [Boletus edulis BED1]|uniref:DNA ligase N terminus-domain-containing protein n=1 Tax=Boletus edulis BED1 TaxID=1328754 RepID=A0AAD4G6L7_BOLED|nr:DNA ligase N terminus-domain-containing protein [Boletus edulis BED1]
MNVEQVGCQTEFLTIHSKHFVEHLELGVHFQEVVDHLIRLLKVSVNHGDRVRDQLTRQDQVEYGVLRIGTQPVDSLHLLLEHLDMVARAGELLEYSPTAWEAETAVAMVGNKDVVTGRLSSCSTAPMTLVTARCSLSQKVFRQILYQQRKAPCRAFATESIQDKDVVIIGGGPVGLALANGVHGLGSNPLVRESVKVALIDGGDLSKIRDWSPPPDAFSNRNLSRGSTSAGIDTWAHVDESRTSPIRDARVVFDAAEIPSASSIAESSEMARLSENLNLQRACLRYLEGVPLSDGTTIRARLLTVFKSGPPDHATLQHYANQTWLYWPHWREQVGCDLRLILPQACLPNRGRAIYGLKEKNLAKTYIKLIPLGMEDPDAVRLLLNWKRPSGKHAGSGDFSNVLYEVVSKRSSLVDGSLSIDDLNDIFDELSQNMGKQRAEVQSKILRRIYNRAIAEEQKWIVRIVFKDLQKVAWELSDLARRLNPEVYSMSSLSLSRAHANTGQRHPVIPGIRFHALQASRAQDRRIRAGSKGKDYMGLYGKHVGEGSLTPHIDAVFDDRAEEIIFDGEMLVWDPVSECNLPFGTLKTAALEFEGKTAKDIRERMDEVMEAREEGLILKHSDSEYMLNWCNKDWIKVKPEYMDDLGETIYVLVVGNYGIRKWLGGVSTLICAVLDDRHGEDGEPSHEDEGDVYIEPVDSFILSVKAAEITHTDQYHLAILETFLLANASLSRAS